MAPTFSKLLLDKSAWGVSASVGRGPVISAAGAALLLLGYIKWMTRDTKSVFVLESLPVGKKPAPSSLTAPQLPTVLESSEDGSTAVSGSVSMSVKGNPESSTNTKSVYQIYTMIEDILGVERASRKRLILLFVLAIAGKSVADAGVLFYFSKFEQIIAQSAKPSGHVYSKPKEQVASLLSSLVGVSFPASLASSLVSFLSTVLSSQLRESLISVLMSRLVLSSHNLCHPEELVDSTRLDALMSDVNQLSVLFVQMTGDYWKKLSDVVVQFFLLVKLTNGLKGPVVFLLYLYVVSTAVCKERLKKAQFSKQVFDHENSLKKYLARVHRHRDAIALWEGGDYELRTVQSLVGNTETCKRKKDFFEFLTSTLGSVFEKMGGNIAGVLIVWTALQAFRQHSLLDTWNKSVSAFAIRFILAVRIVHLLSQSVPSLVALNFEPSWTKISSILKRLHASLFELPKQLPPVDSLPFRVRKSNLCLNDVSAMSPSGVVLFQSMSFEIAPGGALLVHGAKGSGKTALLRVIAGTWPVVMGEVSRPRTGVVCIPSKPYLLANATLREQIVYPGDSVGDSVMKVSDNGVNMEKLLMAIKIAKLSHLLDENLQDLNSSICTTSPASLTETDLQKLMIARAIYHSPKYVLFDDCFGKLEISHFADIVNYLRNDLSCGVVIACNNSALVDVLKSQEFSRKSTQPNFDYEIVLPSNKQPPRHELIVNRSS